MALIYLETFIKLQKRAFVTAYQSPKEALRRARCKQDEQARGAAGRGPAGPSEDWLRPSRRLSEAGSWRHRVAPGLSWASGSPRREQVTDRAVSAGRPLGPRPTPAAQVGAGSGRAPLQAACCSPCDSQALALRHPLHRWGHGPSAMLRDTGKRVPNPRGSCSASLTTPRPPGQAACCQPLLGPQAPHSPDPMQSWT